MTLLCFVFWYKIVIRPVHDFILRKFQDLNNWKKCSRFEWLYLFTSDENEENRWFFAFLLGYMEKELIYFLNDYVQAP